MFLLEGPASYGAPQKIREWQLWGKADVTQMQPCRFHVACRSNHAAAARSLPRATIIRSASGNGRCSAFASSHGARIHKSHSSGVVSITGIAFGWIGLTTAF